VLHASKPSKPPLFGVSQMGEVARVSGSEGAAAGAGPLSQQADSRLRRQQYRASALKRLGEFGVP